MQERIDSIRRLQQGDSCALREIVEEYHARVRGVIAWMGLQPADVDDVAQDTFLHVYQHIGEFEAGTNFYGWLRQIARFKTLAFLEASKREAQHRERTLDAYLLELQADRAERDAGNPMDRLLKCLGELDAKARDMIEKRYSGVALSRLAAEFGRSVAAVKMQLLRIRVALKRCVEAGT